MSWADHYREMERYAAELEQLLSGTSHRRIRAQDDWRPWSRRTRWRRPPKKCGWPRRRCCTTRTRSWSGPLLHSARMQDLRFALEGFSERAAQLPAGLRRLPDRWPVRHRAFCTARARTAPSQRWTPRSCRRGRCARPSPCAAHFGRRQAGDEQARR